MSTNTFNKRTGYFFGGLYKIGYLVMPLGVFVCLSPLFIKDENSIYKALLVGSATFIFGLLLSFTYEGIFFDFVKKSYRNYHSILGFQFGSWKDLPDFKSIRITSNTNQYTSISNGVNPAFSGKVTLYRLGLYTDKKATIVIEDKSKESILSIGELLSKKLNLPLA